MASNIIVKRIVTNRQLEQDAYRAWKRGMRRILNERIAPRTPYRTGWLRTHLWERTTIRPGISIFTLFSVDAIVDYAHLYEIDEDWIATHMLHWPGSRAPYIQPGIEESDDIIREAIGDFVRGK